MYSVPAFKDDNQIRRGRGKGGLCQIWPKSLDHLVSRIPVKVSNRVQGSLIQLPSASRVLWINCYCPCDPGTANFDDGELQETLAGVQWLMENTAHDHVLWNGDLNADFRRNTAFVNIVTEFIENRRLKNAWNKFHVDFTHLSLIHI